MNIQAKRLWSVAVAAAVAALAFSALASADPPSRVARLSYTSGQISFSPAGEDDWFDASLNRPLTSGDRLWSDQDSRAEVQFGGAMARMDADTGLSVLNLDDQITQLQLTQGRLSVRVRRFDRDQVLEIDTPNLALVIREPGRYWIDVDPDGEATTITVREGDAEVYGDRNSYLLDSGQSYRFGGTDLREYRMARERRNGNFDRWADDRDRRYDNSVSARYVSPDMVGYQDLDEHGYWRRDVNYGNVWFPSHVGSGWAPYHDGYWVWIDPWGWTWIDDAPWGFAVSHYGRWSNFNGSWGWVPGPARTRAYYAPALVVFIGGSHFQLSISSGNVGGIAWFPLGPRDVYRPAYPVSRRYFEDVNRSNTVINNTVINNYYGNTNVTNIVYANRQVPGAVVAVPRTTFVHSEPVSRHAVRVSHDEIVREPVAYAAPVAPTQQSLHGGPARQDMRHGQAFERPVVALTPPPAPPVGFRAQQRQLESHPGKPLDEATRKQLKGDSAAPLPPVRVIQRERVAPPARIAPAAEQRGESAPTNPASKARSDTELPHDNQAEIGSGVDQRGKPQAGPPSKDEAAAQSQQQDKAKAAAAVRAEQRAKADAAAKAEQRARAEAQAAAKAEQQDKAKAADAASAEQRAKADAAAKAEQRAKAEQQAAASAERRARAESEAAARTEQRTKADAAAKAEQRSNAEAAAKAEQRSKAEAAAKAEQRARTEAQAAAKAEQQDKAKADAAASAEQRAKADAAAKTEQRAKAEQQAAASAERRAQAESEAAAKAEQRAKAEAAANAGQHGKPEPAVGTAPAAQSPPHPTSPEAKPDTGKDKDAKRDKKGDTTEEDPQGSTPPHS